MILNTSLRVRILFLHFSVHTKWAACDTCAPTTGNSQAIQTTNANKCSPGWHPSFPSTTTAPLALSTVCYTPPTPLCGTLSRSARQCPKRPFLRAAWLEDASIPSDHSLTEKEGYVKAIADFRCTGGQIGPAFRTPGRVQPQLDRPIGTAPHHNRSHAVEVTRTSNRSLNSGNRRLDHLSKALLPLIVSAGHLSAPSCANPAIRHARHKCREPGPPLGASRAHAHQAKLNPPRVIPGLVRPGPPWQSRARSSVACSAPPHRASQATKRHGQIRARTLTGPDQHPSAKE